MGNGTASGDPNQTLERLNQQLTGHFLRTALWGVGWGKLVKIAGLELESSIEPFIRSLV